MSKAKARHRAEYFNPRTPCGVRQNTARPALKEMLFQSTHPLRGATITVVPLCQHLFISIHAPLAGCDLTATLSWRDSYISIHAPLAGCDNAFTAPASKSFKFQSTHPLRGATVFRYTNEGRDIFQSTHPLRGATPPPQRPKRNGMDFNPRTPCGVRRRGGRAGDACRHFNPRTPCGVRQQKRTKKTALFLN